MPFLLDASMHAGPELHEPRGAGLGLAPLSRPWVADSVLLCNLIKQNARPKGAKRANTTGKWLTLPLELQAKPWNCNRVL